MSKRSRRVVGLAGVLLLVCGAGYTAHYLSLNVPVGTSYFAKTLCSGVFVSGRAVDDVMAVDLALVHPLARHLEVDVDRQHRQVSASLAGFYERVAVYRGGLGCTLAIAATPQELRSQAPDWKADRRDEDLPWPDGEQVPSQLPAGVDAGRLAAVVDEAFLETDPQRPKRTRAVVVVYDGQLVYERYATGFDAATPLLGWSMTKSLTSTLVGILVGQGRLDVDAPAPVPEWQDPSDPRRAVTLDQLLRMSSGLEFQETYFDPRADVQQMLFNSASTAALAAAKPLAVEPGTRWSYSSGTSNIVARIVRDTLLAAGEDPFTFPRRALFDPIGARGFVVEPDAAGTFVGSSFSYAPARDWARLGLLYLRGGVWNGERILPEGWVEYSTTPTPHASQGRYGAHFWLNAGDDGRGTNRRYEDLPADTYFMNGFEGQTVAIVPSKKAVIVRLGLSREPSTWNQTEFLAGVLSALEDA